MGAGAAAGGGGGHAGGGATGGGGGGRVSGGGGAVSSGGGAAVSGGRTSGSTGGTVSSGGGSTVTSGGSTNTGGTRATNGSTVVTPSNGVSTGQTAATGGTVTPGQQTGHHGAYNPYAPHQKGAEQNNRNYGVVYGYPFYPFSYGWNPGWYGNGYGNGYNNYTGYNFTNDSGAYGQATENVQAQQTYPTAPVVTGASAVANQAIIANGVDKSPALIAANGSVNQAQLAYNEARERALASLRQKSEYQEALARRHSAAGEVHTAKVDAGPTPPTAPPSDAVVAAATAKLQAGDEVTKLEEQAVATDPAASAAKARLEQASADRDSLKAQLTAQLTGAGKGG